MVFEAKLLVSKIMSLPMGYSLVMKKYKTYINLCANIMQFKCSILN